MLARKRAIPYNAYVRYLLAKGVEDEMRGRTADRVWCDFHPKSAGSFVLKHFNISGA
jgi:hypothetical protein